MVPSAAEVDPRATTPPHLQQPTAKERKYDRQLRLWGANGQEALENTHVLVIIGDTNDGTNGSVVASEILKNLVLPGIGCFTIADAATVTEPDLGVNFFLEPASLGLKRAEETVRLLNELNPDVKGLCETRRIPDWLASPESDHLRKYSMIIICSPLDHDSMMEISKQAMETNTPVIYAQSVGFYGLFSLQIPYDFPIVDTHPDPESIQDLRLLKPWKELTDEVKAMGDIEGLSDEDHGHVPYILLLLYYLSKWYEVKGGQPPDTSAEKREFRELVRTAARTDNPEGGEENYDEAVAAVLKTITPPRIGSAVHSMFASSQCSAPDTQSANFWIIANAVKAFYDVHGVLPLPGSLPDMKAKSSDYIRLQNIYKNKARADIAEVTHQIRLQETALQRHLPIPDSEIEHFCKNAAHIKVLSGTPLPQARLHAVIDNSSHLLTTVFEEKAGLYPVFHHMTTVHSPPADGRAMWTTTNNLEPALENSDSLSAKVRGEVKRAKGAELHNVSAVVGGMVAQEAIKVITRQYVPVDNTVIFDGVLDQIEVLKL